MSMLLSKDHVHLREKFRRVAVTDTCLDDDLRSDGTTYITSYMQHLPLLKLPVQCAMSAPSQ